MLKDFYLTSTTGIVITRVCHFKSENEAIMCFVFFDMTCFCL